MVDISMWKCIELDEVGSTNDEIKKYCLKSGNFVALRANRQTAGRGRRGRSWVSESGNLFFSIALEFNIANLGQLVAVCGLSVLQAIKNVATDANPFVEIKWPNDVLLQNKKVCGMLLEKGEGKYIICGIGINIEHKPQIDNLLYDTICLKEANIFTSPNVLMHEFLKVFSRNLSLLQNEGFAVLRTEWLKNAKNLNKEIMVRQERETVSGIFRGIDDNAGLLLEVEGKIQKVWAGDVFYIERDNE